MKIIPRKITQLAGNEVFVFGSNLRGAHGGGAARVAYNYFGAIWGRGVGLQGQSYAIPTMQGGVETIKPYVDDFIEFARRRTDLHFLVTRIGCGIAGFKDADIAPLFKDALGLYNVSLPREFVEELQRYLNRATSFIQDKIRGSLMAGAAGDALGYAVEFYERKRILEKYGPYGITSFDVDANGKALISDDTQMTLFTANGMLMGITRGEMRGIGGRPENYVHCAYMDWYYTQVGKPAGYYNHTWLYWLPELESRRAPGGTCLNACRDLINGKEVKNNSKGCGGIMRVAPMALLLNGYQSRGIIPYTLEEMALAGAKVAEVTHKHPLGFLPAALLTLIIYKIVPMSLGQVRENIEKVIIEALNVVDKVYDGRFCKERLYLRGLVLRAIRLANSDIHDEEVIESLGEGWVAEETLAIALFCAIRHLGSVEAAIIASVNHSGDSDSTGSVCGNIMGAIYGYEHLKERNIFCRQGRKLEDTLELADVILAIADDLFTSCIISEYDPIDTPEKKQWEMRYCYMRSAGLVR